MTSTDPKAPAPVLGGDVRASGSFEGNLMALAFNGSVDASNASIEQKDETGTISFVKKAGIPANATVKGTFHPQHTPGEGIDLEKIDIVFHALTASGTGRIVPFDGSPKSMQVSLDAKTALKPWNDLLPAMAPFAVSGDATANVHISSTMAPGAQPDITGTAHFRNLGAKMVDMPKSVTDGEGTASFTTKTANIQGAKFRIGESRFVMDCNVSSFTPMTATYKVTSDAVNGLDVQAPAPGAKPLPRPDVFKQVAASGSMKETAPTVVENNLVVSSKNGVVSNIDYTDFTAGVRMTPTTTTINSYSAKALGGAISGSGTMEPKTSKFDVSAKIENVNVAEYFRYKAPAFSDALVGRINADIQVAGEGKDWTAIQKNLTGKGGAVVLEGALNNMNIASQIVSSIQGLPMVPPDIAQRMKARNPKLFSETKTAFQNLSSKFQIANGKITTPDLKLVTSDFSLAGAGWFSLTKEMKLASTLTIAPKMANDLAAEVPAVKYIQGADGRIQVPLDLTGSVLKPTIKVDSADMTALFQKAMMSQGQQQVESQVQKGVKGLLDSFGKKKQPAKPATPPATPPAKPKTTPPDSTRG
jgi:autotransporter translocation and assembly factor TamB